MTGGLMGGYPLGHFINIPEPKRCICTPAVAGISDGLNVDCPIHGVESFQEEQSGEMSVSLGTQGMMAVINDADSSLRKYLSPAQFCATTSRRGSPS